MLRYGRAGVVWASLLLCSSQVFSQHKTAQLFFIGKGEFQHHLEILGLQQLDKQIVDFLYEQWHQQWNGIEEGHRLTLRWIRSSDPEQYGAMDMDLAILLESDYDSAMKLHQIALRKLERWYFAQLSALPTAVEKVDALRRAEFRRRMFESRPLGDRGAHGVAFDIIAALQEFALPAETHREIQQLLTNYELELNQLLLRLDELLLPRPDIRQADIQDANGVLAAARSRAGPYIVCAQIRGLNRRTSDVLVELLQSSMVSQWNAEAHLQFFPFMYNEEVTSLFDLVESYCARDDLNPEKLDDANRLNNAWRGERERATGRLNKRYDLTITPDSYIARFSARWARALPKTSPERREFAKVAEQWKAKEREFVRVAEEWKEKNRRFGDQAAAFLGEAVVEAVTESRSSAEVAERGDATRQRATSWNVRLSPMLSLGEFEECVNALELGELTARELEQSYMRYSNALRKRAKSVRTSLDQVKQEREAYLKAHPEVVDPWVQKGLNFGISELSGSWDRARRQLEQQLDTEVAMILDEKEVGAWRDTISQIRRNRLFPRIRSWIGVGQPSQPLTDFLDVIKVLELTHDESERVGIVGSEYSASVDTALTHWENEHHPLRERLYELASQRRSNPGVDSKQELKRITKKMFSLRMATLEANDGFLNRFASVLDEPNRAKFLDAVARSRWPGVFQPCPMEFTLTELAALSIFDDGQVDAIGRIQTTFRETELELRKEMVRILDEWNSPSAKRRLRKVAERAVGMDRAERAEFFGPHPIIDPLHRRRGLSQATREEIHRLLDAEQVDVPVHILMLLGS